MGIVLNSKPNAPPNINHPILPSSFLVPYRPPFQSSKRPSQTFTVILPLILNLPRSHHRVHRRVWLRRRKGSSCRLLLPSISPSIFLKAFSRGIGRNLLLVVDQQPQHLELPEAKPAHPRRYGGRSNPSSSSCHGSKYCGGSALWCSRRAVAV